MGGLSIVYVHNKEGLFFFTKIVYSRDRWMVKKGQNSVYVVIEWFLMVNVSKIITTAKFISILDGGNDFSPDKFYRILHKILCSVYRFFLLLHICIFIYGSELILNKEAKNHFKDSKPSLDNMQAVYSVVSYFGRWYLSQRCLSQRYLVKNYFSLP